MYFLLCFLIAFIISVMGWPFWLIIVSSVIITIAKCLSVIDKRRRAAANRSLNILKNCDIDLNVTRIVFYSNKKEIDFLFDSENNSTYSIEYKFLLKPNPEYLEDEIIIFSWKENFVQDDIIVNFKEGNIVSTVILNEEVAYIPPPGPTYDWAYNLRGYCKSKIRSQGLKTEFD